MNNEELKLECLKLAYKILKNPRFETDKFKSVRTLSEELYNYCTVIPQTAQLDTRGLSLKSKIRDTTELL